MTKNIKEINLYKVFVDAHMFDHGFEGTASFIQGLYLGLINKYPGRYKIYLGCLYPDKVLDFFGNNPAFEVIKYRTSNRYMRLIFDIPNIIRKVQPDLAHFQYFTPLIKNCAWHVTVHDVLFNDYPEHFPKGYALVRNILFPFSIKRAEMLSTVSKYSCDRISHWYGCRVGSITIIPNGTTQQSLEKVIPQAENVKQILANSNGYFLCVSRFEPRKNQATLLRAYVSGRYWESGIQLVFVGSKTLPVPDFEEAWNAVPKEGKAYIIFLVGLSYSDIQFLNANAKIAIYPSLAEGFGMPPLESAIHATPTLSAGVTGMAEFDFLKPFFIEPTDSNSIKMGIDRVLVQQEDVAAQMQLVQSSVRERYNWANSAKILHHAIARLG